ncbi:MAG: hypothetical protein WD876_02290 [Candidatus Pacearchaeota archaeon]
MLELMQMMFLQSYGFFRGGGIGELFNYWEQAGIFSYVLPFLLIFCIVYVIISKIKIFEDNATVNAVIALSVGLLAMQFDIVPMFFAELFPRVGVGLSIILAILILLGLFIDPRQKFMMWGLFVVGLLIAGFVLYDTGNFTFGYYFYDILNPTYLSWIFFAVILGIIIAGMSKKRASLPPLNPLLYFPQSSGSRAHPEGPMG